MIVVQTVQVRNVANPVSSYRLSGATGYRLLCTVVTVVCLPCAAGLEIFHEPSDDRPLKNAVHQDPQDNRKSRATFPFLL